MNIKIPNVKEIQEIRDSAKSNSKVQSLLKEIITSIKGAAEKGESSVIMSGVGYLTHPENRVLKIACDHLKSEGYFVNSYAGSEVENGCFGASTVAVRGIIISW